MSGGVVFKLVALVDGLRFLAARAVVRALVREGDAIFAFVTDRSGYVVTSEGTPPATLTDQASAALAGALVEFEETAVARTADHVAAGAALGDHTVLLAIFPPAVTIEHAVTAVVTAAASYDKAIVSRRREAS
jgi:hypothetical protein